MEENTSPEFEQNLDATFEQALHQQPAFVPQDLPTEWEVGQHKYFRIVDEHPEFDVNLSLKKEGSLSAKLKEFRELGVKVLDFDRRWGFWVLKTMAPT